MTGFDNIVFTFRSQSDVIGDSIRSLVKLWPSMSIDLQEPEALLSLAGELAAVQCENAIRGHDRSSIYFYCNHAIRDHHDNHGYSVTGAGIGPFAFYTRTRARVEFQLHDVTEIESSSVSLVGSPDPYTAWLCTPALTEISVVTPADPEENIFSQQIVRIVLDQCRR